MGREHHVIHPFAVPVAPVLASDCFIKGGEQIVLGASVQLTGAESYGRYYRDAYQFAIEKINAAGGVKIAGQQHKLALKLYDNQSDVNLSVRQYTELGIPEKGQSVAGSALPATELPTLPFPRSTRCPWFRAAARPTRRERATSNTFSAGNHYFGRTIKMLRLLKSESQNR